MKLKLTISLAFALTTTLAFSAEPIILCGVPPTSKAVIAGGASEKKALEERTDTGTAHPSAPTGKPTETVASMIESLSPQEKCSLLALLNSGTADELNEINGIAEVRARTILSSRPIFELEDLMLLRGFGPGVISKVVAHRKKATE